MATTTAKNATSIRFSSKSSPRCGQNKRNAPTGQARHALKTTLSARRIQFLPHFQFLPPLHPPPRPPTMEVGGGEGGAWAWASHEIDYIYYMRQSGFSKPSRVKLYADKRRGGDYSSGGLFGCCAWGRVSEPSAPGIRRITKEINKKITYRQRSGAARPENSFNNQRASYLAPLRFIMAAPEADFHRNPLQRAVEG